MQQPKELYSSLKSIIKATFILILTCNCVGAQNIYSFKVYLKDQIIEVFLDGILTKTILCSTGRELGTTPVGTFKPYLKKEEASWVGRESIKYYYITKFNNDIAFHSLIEGDHPFVVDGKRLFEARQPSSMGCVRVKKEDAEWIYRLPLGMSVEIIEDREKSY